MQVTRKIVAKPSNSKSPGGSHHIELSGQRFACTAEQRGTGWATANIDADEATLEIGATYIAGKRRRQERITDIARVRLTGDDSDVVTLAAEYTSSQSFRVEFRGVKRIEE